MTKEMNVNQKALQFLIGVACRRETTYYEALAEHCGLPTQGNQLSMVVSKVLGEIFIWCHEKGWPPLTSLVVRKSGNAKGTHGRGFWTYVDKYDLYNHYKILVPSNGFNEDDLFQIGKHFIWCTWNYFETLAVKGNDPTPRPVSTTLELLCAIPGFTDLPLIARNWIIEEMSPSSAEVLATRIKNIILNDQCTPTEAWTSILSERGRQLDRKE